jgi:hypothetical protein
VKKKQTTEIENRDDNIRRLTVEECNELYLKHNNPNMRRLSDDEYAELYEIMYGQKGKEIPENS